MKTLNSTYWVSHGTPLEMINHILIVYVTGEYEATQFQLPSHLWNKLPDYADFGFAVFQLKAGNLEVHPMAYKYVPKDKDRLFFPTVHIHDGEVPQKARYDHKLYYQGKKSIDWRKADYLPSSPGSIDMEKAQGLILPDDLVYRTEVYGTKENRDYILDLSSETCTLVHNKVRQ